MYKHSLNMINATEQVLQVRKWGNSGGLLVPKEWLGKQAKVILIDRTGEIKKEVLEILEPYLEDIEGIYLTGSYARNEQNAESDIDIIAVSNSTKKLIASGKYNVQIYTLAGIKNTIKNYPVSIYPSLLEAKTVMNRTLLKELREIQVNKESLKEYYEECRRIVNINRGFIERDKKNTLKLKTQSTV